MTRFVRDVIADVIMKLLANRIGVEIVRGVLDTCP